MKLYWNLRCGSFAPEAVAVEAGLSYERVRADHRASDPAQRAGYEELKHHNPMGQIPTLVLDDGRVITESAAIALWFAELKPEAALLPPPGSPERAWALRWLMYLACEIYPVDLLESYPERYVATPDHAEALVLGANARIDRDWEIIEQALGERAGEGPFWLGETFCLTDLYTAMVLAWHREGRDHLARSPKLQRLLEATITRPKIAPLWAEYDLGARF
ncbi:glutathione S-transferase family protein [Algihabitans albus]|uniref:glutathione S-transferase family protein n=1 Tax=Algihabitans albus TaxID=2164067 RepID=UPI000E5C78D4|nr:glutathione S-transferase family protein [Algihabitans albus]